MLANEVYDSSFDLKRTKFFPDTRQFILVKFFYVKCSITNPNFEVKLVALGLYIAYCAVLDPSDVIRQSVLLISVR